MISLAGLAGLIVWVFVGGGIGAMVIPTAGRTVQVIAVLGIALHLLGALMVATRSGHHGPQDAPPVVNTEADA